jgi:hypothetical protein
LAWAIGALLIRPLPWSKAMHKRLMWSLTYYNTHTAGRAEAKRQLERLACELTWFDLKQRTLEASMMRRTP